MNNPSGNLRSAEIAAKSKPYIAGERPADKNVYLYKQCFTAGNTSKDSQAKIVPQLNFATVASKATTTAVRLQKRGPNQFYSPEPMHRFVPPARFH